MKLVFQKLNTKKETVLVSLNNGESYKEYNVSDIKEKGYIEFSDLEVSDISLIRVKGDFSKLSDVSTVVTSDNGYELGDSMASQEWTTTTLASYVPTGTIQCGIFKVAPSGWLLCDGQTTYKREDYPDLWDLLSEIDECKGDGETTFTTPDLREVVMVGAGTSTRSAIATHDVYTIGQFKDDQFQNHSHSYTSVGGGGITGGYETDRAKFINSSTTSGASGRASTTTHGKQFGINYIIKC